MPSSPIRPRTRVLLFISICAASLGLALLLGHRHSNAAGQPSPGARLFVPESATSPDIAERYGKLPLSFETNEGQTDPQVKFLSRGPGYTLFLTPDGVVLSLRQPPPARLDRSGAPAHSKGDSSATTQASLLRLKMIGAQSRTSVEGQDELPGKVNYLIGNNPDAWHVNVPTYRRVTYHEIYSGVDMVYYGNQGELEYDFVIAPRTDLRVVKFVLEGAQHLSTDLRGDLIMTVADHELKLRKPVIYQITDQGELEQR